MNQNQIRDYTYDEETRVSVMTLDTNCGRITVSCCASKDDEDVANRWNGFRFCKYKAELEYKRRMMQKLKTRYQNCDSMVQEFVDNKLIFMERTTDDFGAGILECLNSFDKIAYGYWKQYQNAKQDYEEMRDSFKEYCNDWLSLTRGLQEKREKLRNYYETQE